ncbi:MAG: class II fructose-bisphosphate aldolase [bacterium]
MKYEGLKDLIASWKGIVNNQGEIIDSTGFYQLLYPLVYTSVFHPDPEVINACQWLIWEGARSMGLYPASIQKLYEAKGRGECLGTTVPAINLRGLTYHAARAVIRAAKRNRSGNFIFEIARSEIEYTHQSPAEYATVVMAVALQEGYQGPLFIQGDHFQIDAQAYQEDRETELKKVKELIREAVRAGFYNIDIDASTLVDLTKPNLSEQQRPNFEVTALLAAFIREIQPEGITISIGGEIGEIGGKNSTEEELRAYLDGLRNELENISPNLTGLSKVSVQTGTTHGGVVLPNGSVASVKLDFDTLRRLSHVAKEEYALAGAVQHGASTLPAEAFHHFPGTDTAEVHLATEFQNMIYDDHGFPPELKEEIYAYLKKECASEWKEGQTEEQFIYKTRKKGFGPFKKQIWDLPLSIREGISQRLEEKFHFLFHELRATDTYDMVRERITPVYVAKPMPEGLKGLMEEIDVGT